MILGPIASHKLGSCDQLGLGLGLVLGSSPWCSSGVIKNISRYSPFEQQISASAPRVLGVRQIVALLIGALDHYKCVLQTDETGKSSIMAGDRWLLASHRWCPDQAITGRGDVGDPENAETTKWVIRHSDRGCCGSCLVYQSKGVGTLVADLNDDGQLRKRGAADG